MSDKPMSFTDHLAELRKRLIIAAVAFLGAGLAAFSFVEKIADFVMQPAGDLKFVYLSPPELFLAYIKLALMTGLVVSAPVILFQLWRFVQPALGKRERRSIAASLFFGGFFFAGGAAFAFYVIVPFTIKFFLSYSSPRVAAMFAIKDYFDFVSDLAISFGAAFELPVICAILGALGILKPQLLAKSRSLAVLGIFVAAAVLTPPDVISQVLLAIPMLALYELSYMILRVQDRRRTRRERAEAAEGIEDSAAEA